MESLSNRESDFTVSEMKKKREIFLHQLMHEDITDARLLEWGGILALENGDWKTAENIFSSLLERRKKTSDLVGLARALFKQKRLKEAEECHLEALNQIVKPCNLLFVVYKSLGEIHLLQKDFLMAEEYYNKAGTLKPHSQDLIFDRAMMYLKEKNYKMAEKYFQTFIKSNLTHWKAWMGLALTRKALGDEELALACLEQSLDIYPKNSKALELKKNWKPPIEEILSNRLVFSS